MSSDYAIGTIPHILRSGLFTHTIPGVTYFGVFFKQRIDYYECSDETMEPEIGDMEKIGRGFIRFAKEEHIFDRYVELEGYVDHTDGSFLAHCSRVNVKVYLVERKDWPDYMIYHKYPDFVWNGGCGPITGILDEFANYDEEDDDDDEEDDNDDEGNDEKDDEKDDEENDEENDKEDDEENDKEDDEENDKENDENEETDEEKDEENDEENDEKDEENAEKDGKDRHFYSW
jgi:hypothetical protein